VTFFPKAFGTANALAIPITIGRAKPPLFFTQLILAGDLPASLRDALAIPITIGRAKPPWGSKNKSLKSNLASALYSFCNKKNRAASIVFGYLPGTPSCVCVTLLFQPKNFILGKKNKTPSRKLQHNNNQSLLPWFLKRVLKELFSWSFMVGFSFFQKS